MKVAIVGYATDGRVSYEYFLRHGHDVTICDQNANLGIPAGAKTQLGEGYLKDLSQFDSIVRSSGIHPDVILAQNPDVADKITTSVDEFLRACPTKNTIGITGTKGKGTTCTLTAKLLEAAGFRVFLGGNIGRSPLEFIDNLTPEDYVILELSSFQLYDLKHSPHTAVCLMVVPEHLNWHHDLDDYFLAKARLFENQSREDLAIYYAHNDESRNIAGRSPALKLPYYAEPGAHVDNGHIVIAGQQVCALEDIKLLGEHNQQNVCAAVTIAWQSTQSVEALRKVLTTFSGLEHRIEFVREVKGVQYYDDSFGTTPETAIVAIKAFAAPKVLILGGSTKNSDYTDLARVIARENIRAIILIGNTNSPHALATPDIEAALRAEGIDSTIISLVKPKGPTMDEIVRTAQSAAQPGDIVLLSTACASFDTFTDYKDRGNQFKQAVQALV